MQTERNTIHLCRAIAGFITFSVIFTLANFAYGGDISLPYKYPRTNPNLLSNPAFNGSANWTLVSGPVYQGAGSRTDDGSGCIKFPAGEDGYCRLISDYITNIEHDIPYTFSFYMKTQSEPVYLMVSFHLYDASDTRLSYSVAKRYSTSTTGEWQEAVFVNNIRDTNVVKVKVVIEPSLAPWSSDFFIDDAYFGEGFSFAEDPVTSRETFSSSKVKIDELGNWQVYENNQWKDFFPFALIPDTAYRSNFTSLSNQGFNLALALSWKSHVQWAEDAVSTFNPYGMRAGLRLSTFAIPNQTYWTLERLEDDILDINTDLSDTLVCYFWDNENNDTDSWNHWFDMVDVIRDNDTYHPIYILNGHAGRQRIFGKRLSDLCSTYIEIPYPGVELAVCAVNFDIMQYLEKQNIPVSIAQLNFFENETYGFRMNLYYALINGAKGISWWGDCRDANGNRDTNYPAESFAWWDDIPNLREEIDQLLPIIKQPHWTDWSATCSSGDIFYNTRSYEDEGYMILMNPGASSVNATFTLDGYFAAKVRNYFDDTLVTTVANNQFSVTLSAHSTAVYRLEPALVAHWKTDETSGTTATDSSICGNDATCVNSPTWAAGYYDNAVLLSSASSQYLTVADDNSFDYSNGVTVSAWIKLNSQSFGGIWSDIGGNSLNGTIFYVEVTGSVRFRVADANGYDILCSPVYTVQPGEWYHVACTYDNATMKIYVNGEPVTSTSASRTITDNSLTKYIGKVTWGPYYFNGYIDDLRVYQNALTADDIADLAAN